MDTFLIYYLISGAISCIIVDSHIKNNNSGALFLNKDFYSILILGGFISLLIITPCIIYYKEIDSFLNKKINELDKKIKEDKEK